MHRNYCHHHAWCISYSPHLHICADTAVRGVQAPPSRVCMSWRRLACDKPSSTQSSRLPAEQMSWPSCECSSNPRNFNQMPMSGLGHCAILFATQGFGSAPLCGFLISSCVWSVNSRDEELKTGMRSPIAFPLHEDETAP